jgi:hypothetical protein
MRLRFRYSISSFLIAIALVSALLGKMSIEARRQKAAVEWVRDHGGGVLYDWNEHHMEYWTPPPDHPYPKWLRELFGDDYFQTVTYVWVDSSNLTTLKNLPKIHTLILSDNGIVDLSPLESLKKLKVLDLNRNQIIDLAPLARLPLLTSLHLEDNRITDISPLLSLEYLTEAELKGNQVDKAQWESLNAKMKAATDRKKSSTGSDDD